MLALTEEGNNIPNFRHVPLYKYDASKDNDEKGWEIYHSIKYLRRQRKLAEKRRRQKELAKN